MRIEMGIVAGGSANLDPSVLAEGFSRARIGRFPGNRVVRV